MSTTLTAKFETRREAEMTVERLVQQFDIERTDIFIAADGDDNTAGARTAGADGEAGAPSPEARGDADLNGKVIVSVDIGEDDLAGEVRSAFAEFHASEVTAD